MALSPQRILLAEDEPSLRDFISRNLIARGFQVCCATNGLEALSLWEDQRPHLLILDILMPKLDGLEVCTRVRAHSTVPILVLTALDAEWDKVTALNLGADDYLTKPFGVEELLARVRALLRRVGWADQFGYNGPCQYGDLSIDDTTRVVTVRGNEVRLTPTEYALLGYMASHANKVIPHHTLLKQIWGSEYRDEVEYLRVFIGRLRRKIEPDPANPRYLLTEPGVGYRFVAASE
jgi:two-component system KDP operon response regulator KdpE